MNDIPAITVILADEKYVPPSHDKYVPSSHDIHWTKDITSGIKSLNDKQLLEICAFITQAFSKYRNDTDKLIGRLKAILGETGDEQVDNNDDDDDDEGNDAIISDVSWENVENEIAIINSEFSTQLQHSHHYDMFIYRVTNRLYCITSSYD